MCPKHGPAQIYECFCELARFSPERILKLRNWIKQGPARRFHVDPAQFGPERNLDDEGGGGSLELCRPPPRDFLRRVK